MTPPPDIARNHARLQKPLMGPEPRARWDEEQKLPSPIHEADKETVFDFGAITTNGVPFKIWDWPPTGFRKRVENIDIDQDAIFYIGALRYEDVLGGIYVLGYCAILDETFAMFSFLGGLHHNFLRVEHEAGQSLQPSWLQRSPANR